MDLKAAYLICCLPRTGSWLLAEELQSTGVAGRPREYFAAEVWHKFLRKWHMPPESPYSDFFARVLDEATTENGVWGAKAHWYQFNNLLNRLRAIPGLENLPTESLLPRVLPNLRYIHLQRRDRIRHTVSFARASETKVWWEFDSSSGPSRRVLAQTPRFSVATLDDLHATIRSHTRNWRRYFAQCNVDPLELYYEEVAQDPAAAVRRVLDFLEIPAPRTPETRNRRLRCQADDLSEMWVTRYRRIRRAQRAAAGNR
jgi:LPS sulfotransferase NodH